MSQTVAEKLAQYPEWTVNNNKATRTLKFKNYMRTVSFINAVAYMAEQMNHHPDMNFGYNTLEISYQTHDAGNQLTDIDVEAIARVEKLIAGE